MKVESAHDNITDIPEDSPFCTLSVCLIKDATRRPPNENMTIFYGLHEIY